MKDLHLKLEKLLTEAEDCDLIGKLATDKRKRKLFEKLAADLRGMARDIEANDRVEGERRSHTRGEAAFGVLSPQPVGGAWPRHGATSTIACPNATSDEPVRAGSLHLKRPSPRSIRRP